MLHIHYTYTPLPFAPNVHRHECTCTNIALFFSCDKAQSTDIVKIEEYDASERGKWIFVYRKSKDIQAATVTAQHAVESNQKSIKYFYWLLREHCSRKILGINSFRILVRSSFLVYLSFSRTTRASHNSIRIHKLSKNIFIKQIKWISATAPTTTSYPSIEVVNGRSRRWTWTWRRRRSRRSEKRVSLPKL